MGEGQGAPWMSHQLIAGPLLMAVAATQGAICTSGATFGFLLKDDCESFPLFVNVHWFFLWLSATPSCFSPVSMYPYLPCVHSLLLSLLVLLFIFPEHVSVSLLFPISLSPHGLFLDFMPNFYPGFTQTTFWLYFVLLLFSGFLWFCYLPCVVASPLDFGFHRLWIFQLYVIKFDFYSLPAYMCVLYYHSINIEIFGQNISVA